MNTPEENRKNLQALKAILTEILLTLSIAWMIYWCWFEDSFAYSISILLGSVLFIHMLKYLKVSLKYLYALCSIALTGAILVTIFI